VCCDGAPVTAVGAVRRSIDEVLAAARARLVRISPAAAAAEQRRGALLIDTPGLRELALWSEESASPRGFDDIETLVARCAFRDCHHETEPGCAVLAAVEGGKLPEDRLHSWRKLEAEQRWLLARTNPDEARRQKQRWRVLNKAQRHHKKG